MNGITDDQEKALELIVEAAHLLGWAMALCPGDEDKFLSAIIIGPIDTLAELGDIINDTDDLH